MTANLLTLNSPKTEFLLIGLQQQLTKIHNCSFNKKLSWCWQICATRLEVSQVHQTVPFHMLGIVSYCAIVTLSLRRAVLRYLTSKNVMTLKWGQRSLKVI